MTKKSWILGETFFGHFQTLWTYRMRVRACDYIVSDSLSAAATPKNIYGAIVLRRKDYYWIYWNYSFCVCDDHCESKPTPRPPNSDIFFDVFQKIEDDTTW